MEILERDGKLPPATFAHPLMQWPLAGWNGLRHYGVHGVSGFVDQNPAFGQILDYSCGSRTYDTSNYNHQGTDFFTWPFGWYMMDNSLVAVVAAAPGTIVFKSDGNFDRSCSFNNNNWNAVYIRHADNSIAWYGHLKNGSVTTKNVGETVAVGEYLGIVGSSGNSTGPHLHLEVYNSSGTLNETFQGTCNSMNPDSWWANQRPYVDSGLNHLATGFASPNTPSCPSQESPNEQDIFNNSDNVYFMAYYRDQLASQIARYRVYRPDGSLHYEWTHNSPADYYATGWWWFDASFAPSGPAGIFRFEITFQSQTYNHYFAVGVQPTAGSVTGQLQVTKLPGGQVSLSWGGSCLSGDTDYEVYEGTLGAFTSHTPRACSTGGALSHSLTPQAKPPGSGTYFVVAPRNPMREGSLGTNSSGLERPQSSAPCLPQLVENCSHNEIASSVASHGSRSRGW